MPELDRFRGRMALLPQYPRIREGYKLISIEGDSCLIFSGLRSLEIKGPFHGIDLVRFIGRLTGNESIEVLLGGQNSFQVAFYLDLLDGLYHAGILASTNQNNSWGQQTRYTFHTNLFDHVQSLQNLYTVEKDEWENRIRGIRVAIIGLGRVGSQLARLLAIAGIRSITGLDDGIVDQDLLYTDSCYNKNDLGYSRTEALRRHLANVNDKVEFHPLSISPFDKSPLPVSILQQDLLTVTLDVPQPEILKLINRQCIEAGTAWTSYRISWDTNAIEIGPTVYPYETACYTCYQLRRRSNLEAPMHDEFVEQSLNSMSLPLLNHQFTHCISLMASEILRITTRALKPLTYNAVLAFDILRGQSVNRPLFRLPDCPSCGRSVRNFPPQRFWSELTAERRNT